MVRQTNANPMSPFINSDYNNLYQKRKRGAKTGLDKNEEGHTWPSLRFSALFGGKTPLFCDVPRPDLCADRFQPAKRST